MFNRGWKSLVWIIFLTINGLWLIFSPNANLVTIPIGISNVALGVYGLILMINQYFKEIDW